MVANHIGVFNELAGTSAGNCKETAFAAARELGILSTMCL